MDAKRQEVSVSDIERPWLYPVCGTAAVGNDK
jgi:hypothetical protein